MSLFAEWYIKNYFSFFGLPNLLQMDGLVFHTEETLVVQKILLEANNGEKKQSCVVLR